MSHRPSARTLQQRLSEGVVLGAEGYVFELERRGYIKAGPYVPEVILDAPEAVLQLHREFLRAGAEVMVSLTYYAHRDKLKVVGRDGDLEEMNRTAVRMANQVAREGDALVAANISNTWAYDPADARRTSALVRAQYEEQLGWAVEEGVDFVIAETNDYLGEALIGLEVCTELGLPAMVTFASVHPTHTYDGYEYVDACRRLADAGATIVGLNCSRGPQTIKPLLDGDPRGRRLRGRGAARPLPHLRRGPGVRVAHDRRWRPGVPDPARGLLVHALRDGRLRGLGAGGRHQLRRRLLRRRTAPRARDGRGARPRHAGESLLARDRAPPGARNADRRARRDERLGRIALGSSLRIG